jgi:hypothetical protein
LGANRGALLDNIFCCVGYKMLGEITLLVDGGVISSLLFYSNDACILPCLKSCELLMLVVGNLIRKPVLGDLMVHNGWKGFS